MESVADTGDLASLVLDLLVYVLAEDLEASEGDEGDDANEDDVFNEVSAAGVSYQAIDFGHHGRTRIQGLCHLRGWIIYEETDEAKGGVIKANAEARSRGSRCAVDDPDGKPEKDRGDRNL